MPYRPPAAAARAAGHLDLVRPCGSVRTSAILRIVAPDIRFFASMSTSAPGTGAPLSGTSLQRRPPLRERRRDRVSPDPLEHRAVAAVERPAMHDGPRHGRGQRRPVARGVLQLHPDQVRALRQTRRVDRHRPLHVQRTRLRPLERLVIRRSTGVHRRRIRHGPPRGVLPIHGHHDPIDPAAAVLRRDRHVAGPRNVGALIRSPVYSVPAAPCRRSASSPPA